MDQFRRPNGIFNAKIEPTGRLKLPAEVRDWLRGNGFKTVFVTSIDMKFVSIYPPPVWTAFERALENTEANYEDAQAVLLVARANGANSPVDDTGRITIPAEARALLASESNTVALEVTQGKIQLEPESAYKSRLEAAKRDLANKVKAIEKLGRLDALGVDL
jgi:DNA-binding transcriptional regulator/RsmH inhibitor MraZ